VLYVNAVRSPMLAGRAGWIHTPLDVDAMRAAPTFMPEGLYLAHVGYPEAFAVPPASLGSVPWSGIWSE
jgi:tRNA pseudouridine38-40 synthase